MFLGTKDLF